MRVKKLVDEVAAGILVLLVLEYFIGGLVVCCLLLCVIRVVLFAVVRDKDDALNW